MIEMTQSQIGESIADIVSILRIVHVFLGLVDTHPFGRAGRMSLDKIGDKLNEIEQRIKEQTV